MQSQGYKLGPREGVYVEPVEQIAVGEILQAAGVFERIPAGNEIEVEVGRKVEASLTLAQGHGTWREEYFSNVETLSGLPRQPMDTKTLAGLVHVEINVVEKRTPGMASHFGYRGYYLSLLVNTNEKRIWDARGEKAS